jgi:hypothetical protein
MDDAEIPGGVYSIKKEWTMSVKSNVSHIISLALRGIALAMGVAAVVLGLWKAATPESTGIMVGIGLFALALDALDRD